MLFFCEFSWKMEKNKIEQVCFRTERGKSVYTAKEVIAAFNATINGFEEIHQAVAKSLITMVNAISMSHWRKKAKSFPKKTVDPVLAEESAVFEDMDASERELAMKLLAKYSDSLSRRMGKFR